MTLGVIKLKSRRGYVYIVSLLLGGLFYIWIPLFKASFSIFDLFFHWLCICDNEHHLYSDLVCSTFGRIQKQGARDCQYFFPAVAAWLSDLGCHRELCQFSGSALFGRRDYSNSRIHRIQDADKNLQLRKAPCILG